MQLTITGLHVYPVKSCAGMALSAARLGQRGVEHDREWMVVRPDGMFVTQRELPQLALIGTSLGEDALELRAPGQPVLRLPVDPAPSTRIERAVVVWLDTCPALDEGDAAADWLSAHLSTPVRLVRFHPRHRRLSSLDWTEGIEAENGFSDGYPLLVLSEESVEDLNRRLGGPGEALPMNRFRPNLVVRGGGAGAEDRVRDLRSGALHLRIVKPCMRCRIIGTDQATAAVGVEPLRTLAGYRRDERLGGVVFGQNAIVVAGAGARAGADLWVGQVLEAEPPGAAQPR